MQTSPRLRRGIADETSLHYVRARPYDWEMEKSKTFVFPHILNSHFTFQNKIKYLSIVKHT